MKQFTVLCLMILSITVLCTRSQKVICYFANWNRYLDNTNMSFLEDLDANLCTHLIYSFHIFDSETATLKSQAQWEDKDADIYKRITNLKSQNPNLKVLPSFGVLNERIEDKHSHRLKRDSEKRQNFIQKIIQFIVKYGFDGIDIDLEYLNGWIGTVEDRSDRLKRNSKKRQTSDYPKCAQGNCNTTESDKYNFVKVLRKAFEKINPRPILTATFTPSGEMKNERYDIASISRYLDFLNILTFDFQSTKRKKPHDAESVTRDADELTKSSFTKWLNGWVNLGIPKDKLVIGLPACGRCFTQNTSSVNSLSVLTTELGIARKMLRKEGLISYYEICNLLRQGWRKTSDQQTGHWITQGNQWISYNDLQDASMKARYAVNNGLGGVIVGDVSMDDFQGKCCGTKYPFLKAINYGTFETGADPNTYSCP